jgi:hypothetical protein
MLMTQAKSLIKVALVRNLETLEIFVPTYKLPKTETAQSLLLLLWRQKRRHL